MVEDFVAAMAPVLAPIFGAVGVCRYPTKPLATAVQVHMVSFSTYLPGRPSLAYPRVIHAVFSGEMPHGYTTLKSERELEENLMGLLRARTRKACPLPREHGPVNWYSAPLSLEGVPSQTAIGKNHWVGQGRNLLDVPLKFSTVKSST